MAHSPPVLNGRQVVAALERAGFTRVGETKHIKMRGPDGQIVIVPNHPGEDIKPGTLRNILKQARLTIDEFRAVV